MKQPSKINLSDPELKLIKNNSEIYCYHCGNNSYRKNGFTKNYIRRYKCKRCNRYFLDNKGGSKYTNNLPLGDDVWQAEQLGLRVNQYHKQPKLVFLYIQQQWLKEAVKKYVKYSATTKQLRTLQDFITAINCFSKFISEKHSYLTWDSLDRNIILDYLVYLNSIQLNWSTKKNRISCLKQLLSF
jgi:integrase/recombinase XerD